MIGKAANLLQSEVINHTHHFHLNHRKSVLCFNDSLTSPKGCCSPKRAATLPRPPLLAPKSQRAFCDTRNPVAAFRPSMGRSLYPPNKEVISVTDSYLSLALPRIHRTFEADRSVTTLSKNKMARDDAHCQQSK